MTLELSDFEATLGNDTMREILRRFPDEAPERNNEDPHDFQVCKVVTRRTRATDVAGVTAGWRNE